jgi:hypothetical protein
LLLALSGCGLVSGLDTLHVDASTGDDASGDATTGEAGGDDGAVDAATSTDALVDGAGVRCGSSTCTAGSVCCIAPNDPSKATCAPQGCPNGYIELQCDDKSDCTNAQQVCCFTATSGSTCTSSGSVGCTMLCNSPSQCPQPFSKCEPFDAGYGLSLSKCQ